MPLLILLSAMLTALTGAITGVRAPDTRIEQVQLAAVAEAAAQIAQAVVPARPALEFAALVETRAPFRAATPWQEVSRYSDRRRE